MTDEERWASTVEYLKAYRDWKRQDEHYDKCLEIEILSNGNLYTPWTNEDIRRIFINMGGQEPYYDHKLGRVRFKPVQAEEEWCG